MIIKYDRFYREFGLRTPSNFSKIVPLEKIPNLPVGSVLHVLDNLKFNMDIFLTPDINNKLYKLDPIKKLIYNVPQMDSNLVKNNNHKIIVRKVGVIPALNKFKQDNVKDVRYMKDKYDIVFRPNVQNVFCYNSLFNCRIMGILKHYRLINFVFANLITVINNLPDVDHFIHIPTENMIFSKNDFLRAYKKIDKTTLKYSESSYYIYVLYIMCMLEKKTSVGLFNQFDTTILDKINFVMTSDTDCFIFNFSKLLKMSEKVDLRLKVLNTFNILATSDEIVEDTNIVKPKTIEVNPLSLTPNSPAFREPLSNDQLKENVIEYANAVESEGLEIINEDQSLTDSQKASLSNIASSYSEIILDGESVKDLLTSEIDQQINNSDLTFLEDDEAIVDKTMLASSISNFGESYLKKLYKKDLVLSLLSFNKLGMYLSNIEETKNNDFMNKSTSYKVTFTDTSFKNHIIKFTIPDVNEDGSCLVNGSKKKLKMQRVNNPIVKVSPTRVTLNSTFNKCLVEKNSNVANNYFTYVFKMLTKSKKDIKIDYQTQNINTLKFPKITIPEELASVFENEEIKLKTDDIFEINDYVKTNFGYGLVTNKDKDSITIERTINPKKISSNCCALANKLSTVSVDDTILVFNFNDRRKLYKDKELTEYLKREKKYGLFIGKTNNKLYYFSTDGVLNIVKAGKVKTATFLDLLTKICDVSQPPLYDYCNVRILNKKIPIWFLLCYRFGITHMLNYLNVDYDVFTKGGKLPDTIKSSDLKIKFRDKTLVIKRTPNLNSLIFAGLAYFKYTDVNLEDLDDKDVYFDLLVNKDISTNMLKGIDQFFDLFMDPITQDVLAQMGEPTNFKDLLIRAVSLLTTADHKQTSSSANFRFRSYETFVGTAYKELARAYCSYKYKTFNASNKFSIQDFAIEKKILSSQLFNNMDTLNPIHDIKQNCAFTHVGDGGRSSESFVIDDRKFPEDGIGIISEATVDSGGVAMNAQLSMNPTIVNARGVTITKSPEDVSAAELLSVTGVLMPSATNDDGKRLM